MCIEITASLTLATIYHFGDEIFQEINCTGTDSKTDSDKKDIKTQLTFIKI